ncbi:hypothetical protein [Dyella sp. C9]|uniref:hypothetical protein n=1 Tax=Dyella sp. C9 TaxID=2202154 RepID=UPI000DF0193C|nr:hypothetical protein [Dyella sp. C9]
MTMVWVTALLVLYGIIQGWAYIFGPAVIETGDYAANALQIIDAGHFKDIYGNYSRWGFNHPGPFFFYAYSAGEALFFKGLKLVSSPDQAHVLTGILIQSLCFGWAAWEFARLTQRRALAVFIAAAAIVLPHTSAALSSIWPPHVLLGPYFALVVSCASLSLGNIRSLSVAVLMTCILCHGHVAQPLMTMPMLGVALISFLVHLYRSGPERTATIRSLAGPILLSALIVAVFLLPIAIDLTRCPNCNAQRILDYLHNTTETRPRWGQAANYVASYFFFDHHPDWISNQPRIHRLTWRSAVMLLLVGATLILPYVLRRWMPARDSQALRVLGAFVALAAVLALLWARRITGPLYEFNSFFIYALVLWTMMLIAAAAAFCVKLRYAPAVTLLLLIVAAASLVRAPDQIVASGSSALQDTMAAPENPHELAILVQDNRDAWPTTVTLALWLARHGAEFMVPNDWAFLFGWDHALDTARIVHADRPIRIWRTTSPYKNFAGATFEPGRFCWIGNHTPELGSDMSAAKVDDARASCTLNTLGIPQFNGEDWTWTQGNVVILQFRGHHADHPVQVDLDAFPYLGDGKLEKQRVTIYINQTSMGTIDVTGQRTLSFNVDPAVWNSSGVVTLTAYLPDAKSPAELGLSNDARKLGLGFRGFSVKYGEQDVP